MGPCGTATRTAALERVTLGGVVVDEWRLGPSHGHGHGHGRIGPLAAIGVGPIYVSAVDPQVGYGLGPIDLMLIVSRIDPYLLQLARERRLPAALAATVAVMVLMHVADHDHARVVMRHVMRAAVDGTIPTVPAGAGDAHTWGSLVATLCRVTVRPVDVAAAAVGVS